MKREGYYVEISVVLIILFCHIKSTVRKVAIRNLDDGIIIISSGSV
ncbi:MAG: hypothetical protein M3156_00315 [Thermoproteota archaeon]|nr:hypothetical protein [Thermoproteota archaeon]